MGTYYIEIPTINILQFWFQRFNSQTVPSLWINSVRKTEVSWPFIQLPSRHYGIDIHRSSLALEGSATCSFPRFTWEKTLWFTRTYCFLFFFFLLFLLFCLMFLSLFLYHPKYFIFPFVSIFEHAFSYIATQIPMYSKYFSVPEECRNIKKNKEWSFSTASDIFLVHCWCGLQKSSRIFHTWKLSTLSSL